MDAAEKLDEPEVEAEAEDTGLTLEEIEKLAKTVTEGDIVGVDRVLSRCESLGRLEMASVQKILVEQSGFTAKDIFARHKEIKEKVAKSAKDAGAGSTHASYAKHLLAALSVTVSGKQHQPVGSRGHVYIYKVDEGIWHKQEKLMSFITDNYDGMENCKKSSDYKGVEVVAYKRSEDKKFFDNAPIGLATKGGFYSVEGEEIKVVPLTPDHRQTALCPVEPEDIPTPRFTRHLQETFSVYDEEKDGTRTFNKKATSEQINMAQEAFGMVAVCGLYKFQKVIFLYGPGGNGKGVLLRLVEAVFPDDVVGAVPPYLWDNPVMCSELSTLTLNTVGELDKTKPIPASKFKNGTGEDYMLCKTLYQMPFKARITASHIFAGNYYPYTTDHSRGFYRRWLFLSTPNVIAESKIDPDLADKIIGEELPGVVHWMLEGARQAVARGHVEQSTTHGEMMKDWKLKHTPVLAFLNECDLVEVKEGSRCSRSALYTEFQTWCAQVGRKPLHSGNFYDELERSGYKVTVKVGKRPGQGEKDLRVRGVLGVALLTPDGQPACAKVTGEEPL